MKVNRIVSRLMKAHRQLFSAQIQDFNTLRRMASDPRERQYWEDCIRSIVEDWHRRKEEMRTAIKTELTARDKARRAPWYVRLYSILGIRTAR